jgi:hypothetical protein
MRVAVIRQACQGSIPAGATRLSHSSILCAHVCRVTLTGTICIGGTGVKSMTTRTLLSGAVLISDPNLGQQI